MVHYIEEFVIDGIEYGIEDYKDGRPPSDHFMPDRAKKRYQCWRGGGGIGDTNTLMEARQHILNCAVNHLRSVKKASEKRLKSVTETLSKLDTDDVFKLGQFLKREIP